MTEVQAGVEPGVRVEHADGCGGVVERVRGRLVSVAWDDGTTSAEDADAEGVVWCRVD